VTGQQLTAGAMAQLKCNAVVAVQGKSKPMAAGLCMWVQYE